MEYENLISRNIFPLPIDDKYYLLYAPLAKNMVIAEHHELDKLERQLADNEQLSQYSLQHDLIDAAVTPQPNYVTSPRDVFALTILPNNICNFSCSYCYAAKGHGNDELSETTLRTVLDFFVNPDRISRRDLYISFGGGGEPLLSWDKVLFALEYSDSLAAKHGFNIHYSYASNGSVMNEQILSAIKKYDIKTNISFDILEDVQNRQRRNYQTVCNTLDTMLANGIFPTINSVITPLNVERQPEMVKEVHRRFPKLRRLSFDYVVDAHLFDDTDRLRDFFNTYTNGFYAARKTAASYGIVVSSIKHHNLEQIKSRACAGGFDLTPQGKLSVCFFISSPKEALYDDFIYGEVADSKVVFDEEKFHRLVSFSANSQQRCRNCFIRWHCGGGCLFHTKSYTTEQMDAMCDFQRKFSMMALLEQITENHHQCGLLI